MELNTSTDFPEITVKLPREAALKVSAALQTLTERKAEACVDKLLADFLQGVSEDYLELQVERMTPEEYYLEAAKSIPELREKIIQQAKKALQKGDRVSLSGGITDPKKSKKREKAESAALTSPGSELSQ